MAVAVLELPVFQNEFLQLLDIVQAFLGLSLVPDGVIWLQSWWIYDMEYFWNISVYTFLLEVFTPDVQTVGLSPEKAEQTVRIQPLGFYNQYLDLGMFTWMKRSEGSA